MRSLPPSSEPAGQHAAARHSDGAPRRGHAVVLAGPSGVGKGAVIARVRAALPDLELSVSVTTRAPRPGERDGVDYRFADPAAFDALRRTEGLLEWEELFGHHYGTPRAPVETALQAGRDVLLELDVRGARQVRERLGSAFLILVAPPTMEELERRLRRRRTESEEQLARRLARAQEELAAGAHFDAVVVNDELERATAQVVELLGGLRAGIVKEMGQESSSSCSSSDDALRS